MADLTPQQKRLIETSSASGYFQPFNGDQHAKGLVEQGLAERRGRASYKLTEKGKQVKGK